MASFTGTIYLTINNINRKIYIGQTITNKKSYIGSGAALKKAIKKYGKSNFSKSVLISNICSEKELNNWEEFYINLFNSRNKTIGYNIKEGGKNAGFKHTSEAIAKIRERSNREDNKERFKHVQKLAAKSRIGKYHTKESKLKMISTKFGYIKEIEIYSKDKELLYTCNFSTEASKLTNVSRSAISNNLINRSKSAGNYIFKYKN